MKILLSLLCAEALSNLTCELLDLNLIDPKFDPMLYYNLCVELELNPEPNSFSFHLLNKIHPLHLARD